MQFRTFDELSASMDADRLLVHVTSLGGATNRQAVALWRRRSNIFSEYVGVFAIERGRVLGQTIVKRLRYTFPDGTETISAIASVGTRPDRARHGVGRQVLTEVHRRERQAGMRYAGLWTNPSWGAHRLYEQLGYRDVYAFPWAVRALRTHARRLPRRGVAAASRRELPEIERFHDRETVGRIGFCERPTRFLQLSAATKDFDPAREMLVAREHGAIVGYAHAQSNASRTICGEMVAANSSARTALVAALEQKAAGTALAFTQTPVSDAPALFHRRGYVTIDAGWWVFMVAELGRTWAPRAAEARFATSDPRFQCLSGDRF